MKMFYKEGVRFASPESVMSNAEVIYEREISDLEIAITKKEGEIYQLNLDINEEENEVEKTRKNRIYSLSLSEAHGLTTKRSLVDYIVYLLLAAEAYIGFNLFLTYLGDKTLTNIIFAIAISCIVMFLALILEWALKHLPSYTKYIYFFITVVSAGFFIFELAGLRETISFSDIANDTDKAMEHSDLWFNLSLLSTLLFGGPTLKAFMKEPLLVKEAEEITKLYQKLEDLKEQKKKCEQEVGVQKEKLRQLKKINQKTYVYHALSSYLKGTEKRFNLFHSKPKFIKDGIKHDVSKRLKDLKNEGGMYV